MSKPKIIDDPLYQLLRNEKVQDFNVAKAKLEAAPDFSNCDFRGLDLREMDASGINFTGAYFRGADLRGIDFRHSNLEGASIAGTNISGAYFPAPLRADEIMLSLTQGTRMRTLKPKAPASN